MVTASTITITFLHYFPLPFSFVALPLFLIPFLHVFLFPYLKSVSTHSSTSCFCNLSFPSVFCSLIMSLYTSHSSNVYRLLCDSSYFFCVVFFPTVSTPSQVYIFILKLYLHICILISLYKTRTDVLIYYSVTAILTLYVKP